MRKKLIYGIWLTAISMNAPQAFACAVCFGDPNSPMARAALAGAVVLVGVVAAVLTGIGILGFKWMRRESKLAGDD